MKSLSILVVFITFCLGTSYGQDTKAVQKPPKKVASGKDDNCMLNGSYNKPLKITSFLNNKTESPIKSTDFVQFNDDGTYIQVVNGVTCNGTWTYETTTKKINVNCDGIKSFDLNETVQGQFELKEGNNASIQFNKQ